MMLTLGSLFDGIGGWLLAAQHNGVKPIWSSEIEKFPMAVTKHHFPDVIQLGDITKLDGATLPPVDIICAGSPCQDLSVAGKREGLKGERSGLFVNAINIVRRMRDATGGKFPRFFVWENVPGAFSSNKGLDFRAVLEEIGQTEVPMPANDKWAENGVAQLPGCEIAWRVLDAVMWVPQRRKRIFLVADFAETNRCAGKILFVSKSLPGDIAKSSGTRKRTPSSAEKSIRTTSELVKRGGNAVVKIRCGRDDGTAGKGALIGLEQSFTLGTSNDQTLFQEQQFVDVYNGAISGEKAVTLTAASGSVNTSGPKVLEQKGFDAYQHHNWRESETIGPLTTHGNGVRGDTPLVADMSITGGQNAYAIGNGQTAQLRMQDKVGTLNCMHDQIAIMQKLAVENKQLEVSAPMMDEDSTDKT